MAAEVRVGTGGPRVQVEGGLSVDSVKTSERWCKIKLTRRPAASQCHVTEAARGRRRRCRSPSPKGPHPGQGVRTRAREKRGCYHDAPRRNPHSHDADIRRVGSGLAREGARLEGRYASTKGGDGGRRSTARRVEEAPEDRRDERELLLAHDDERGDSRSGHHHQQARRTHHTHRWGC